MPEKGTTASHDIIKGVVTSCPLSSDATSGGGRREAAQDGRAENPERSMARLTPVSRAARPNHGRTNMGLTVSLELGIGCNRIPTLRWFDRAVENCRLQRAAASSISLRWSALSLYW